MPPLCSGLACDCFDQRITNSDAVKILGLIFKRISLALRVSPCGLSGRIAVRFLIT